MNITHLSTLTLFLLCIYLETVCAYGPNVCSRRHFVTYTEQVYEPVQVPFQKKSSWFGGYHTAYETKYQWQTKIKYRLETKYFCCPGYEGTEHNCQPRCEPTCPANSHCFGPNRCTCDDGYTRLLGECVPNCSGCGKNSYCLAPSLCRCNTGYRQIGNKGDCVPQCEKACGDHSFCSAPDICECEVGYRSDSDSSTCQPVCTASCGSNSYCKEPDNCECQTGYKLADDGSQECKPVCDSNCGPHSSCHKPGECQCDEGYQQLNGSCQPMCVTKCQEHSSCTEPDHCECNEGYRQRKQNQCEPICSKGCSAYARCVSPNECECFPGYEMSEQNCVPKCSNGCPNGYCFAPEVCACNPGYLMGPSNKCEPQCTTNCIHGHCSQPDICECDPGYHFMQDSQHICEPICEPNCQNSDCLGPNICICHLGYEPELASSHLCRPSCQLGCVNGTCVAPDSCSCLPGFKPDLTENSSNCQPNCSQGCQNGNCIAPEICECYDGYEQSSNGCQLSMTTKINSLSTTVPTAPLELSEQPLTNCTNGCICWNELTAADKENLPKCMNICIDEYDKPCLDLAQCRCKQSELNSQLICNASDANESSLYVCLVFASPKINTNSEAALNSSKSTSSGVQWPTILVWCVSIAIFLISLIAVIHYYLKHRSNRIAARRADELCFENEL